MVVIGDDSYLFQVSACVNFYEKTVLLLFVYIGSYIEDESQTISQLIIDEHH